MCFPCRRLSHPGPQRQPRACAARSPPLSNPARTVPGGPERSQLLEAPTVLLWKTRQTAPEKRGRGRAPGLTVSRNHPTNGAVPGGEPHRTQLASTRSGWAGRRRRCSGSGTWTPSKETPGPKRWFYLQVAKNGLLLCTRRKLTTMARLRQGPCAAPGPARPPLWGLRLTGLWDSAAAGPRPLR